MSLLSEHFDTIAGAQACAARLIAAGTQFTFASHDGLITISYPDTSRAPELSARPQAEPPRDPNPPRSAA